MFRHDQYTRGRLAQTEAALRAAGTAASTPITEMTIAGPTERIGYVAAQELDYAPLRLGHELGPQWSTHWVRGSVLVPDGWSGGPVHLRWKSWSEATLWIDGVAVYGLNSARGERQDRIDAPLFDRATPGDTVDFVLEIACNGMFGSSTSPFASVGPYVVDQADLVLVNPDALTLAEDFSILRKLLNESFTGNLDESLAGQLTEALLEFADLVEADDPTSWAGARAVLAPLLAATNGTHVHRVTAIGHAHLDTAWLWPLEETRRKAVRSWVTQCDLLDRYPDYRFCASQAQQYQWIREDHPELFERIKAHVGAGRWVPVGGSWVEPDGNLPSGESYVRQFLLGQAFFQEHFGARSRTFWCPDTFGYHGQLPQLMAQAGMDRFLTQKLSWNRFTTPPHHSFRWAGVDGTEVVTHFPPADTYNSEATVAELRRVAATFRNHGEAEESLLVYGYGDGGGGPHPDMIERLRRMGDLQGVPSTEMGSPEEFFDVLEGRAGDLPAMVGELYFEYHRGTYTSQAHIKAGNRTMEFLLHDVELLASLAGEDHRDEIRAMWEEVCCLQFHDILPGSSIEPVNDSAREAYDRLTAQCRSLITQLLERLAQSSAGSAAAEPHAFNTLAVPRTQVAHDPAGDLVLLRAEPLAMAESTEPAHPATLERAGDGFVLANGLVRARIDAAGQLTSLVHLATGREALAGPGHVHMLHDDDPIEYDAWDIDPYSITNGMPVGGASVVQEALVDPLRCAVTATYALGRQSSFQVEIRVDADTPYVSFAVEADWRERHQLWKVLFPLAVRSSRATYEMPFGFAERPTHASTLADFAQYEVAGHRWADLSEYGFGVSVLSDAKYGWSCRGNELGLSLLRAPTSPDPQADQGDHHRFSFAVMPHTGSWQEAGVADVAAAFNHAVVWAPGAVVDGSVVRVDDPNLLVDTVKPAEDGDGVILRLYERHGGSGTARLLPHSSLGGTTARLTNILEDPGAELVVDADGSITLDYSPHQVLTVRLS
jgi:alpha-mannosidase